MPGTRGANIEIRPARADEMREVERIDGYAFANNTLPPDEPEPNPLAPEQTLCGFDGNRMVATSGAYAFKMRFNGRAVAADGVTIVATDPGYRRRGIVRRLITGLLERAKSNGVPVSILWASMGAIYQRFGYGLATNFVSYDIEPRYVQFQYGEPAPGTVALMSKADALPHLDAVYRRFTAAGTGQLHRVPLYWELMLRRQQDQHTYIAVYFDPAGTPGGYCLYRTRSDEQLKPAPSQIVDVFDLAWVDIEAYRGLWSYLGGHDLAARIRMEFVPEDDPAPGMLLEPRMLHRRTWDAVWLRIVDAAAALGARGWDTPGETTLTIVDDDICTWNNGRYRLVAGPSPRIEKLPDGDADIVTPPGALASLVSGYSRPSDLARTGRLELSAQAEPAALDALFATRRRPSCPNMF